MYHPASEMTPEQTLVHSSFHLVSLEESEFGKEKLLGQFLLTSNAARKSILKSRFKGFSREYYLVNFPLRVVTIKALNHSLRFYIRLHSK